MGHTKRRCFWVGTACAVLVVAPLLVWFLLDRTYDIRQADASLAQMPGESERPLSIESTVHHTSQPDMVVPRTVVASRPASEAVTTWMQVLQDSFQGGSPGEYELTREWLEDALHRAHAEPNETQIQAVSQEIARLKKMWNVQENKDKRAFRTFACTLQLEVYWYFAPPSLDEAQRATLKQQHEELDRIGALLPERLIKEFGAPPELQKEIDALFQREMSYARAVMYSPFLRSSQVPMSPAEFDTLKQKIESTNVRFGRQFEQRLAEAASQWRALQSRKKKGFWPWQRWRQLSPEGLRKQQYGACRSSAAIMCGTFVREFEMLQMNKFYRVSRADVYPFCQVSGWDMEYEEGVGYLFWITPWTEVQPQ
jgi:hypothetical protein